MIHYMLGKLEQQIRQSIVLQQEGNLPEALSGYELVFEALRFYEDLGYCPQVDNLRRLALSAQQTPEITLYILALILYHRQQYQTAHEAAEFALLMAPKLAMLHILQARIRMSLGDLNGALAAYEHANTQTQDPNSAREALFAITVEREMPGEDYYSWLQRFHQWLRPASYVEIGLGHGRSLALAGPDTKAIGIDPYQGFWEKLNYICPHGPAALFPLASDDFFARHDLRTVLDQKTFDLAFIDGLHLFEQVLKDFINLERYARKDSVILIHDCLPIAPVVAERKRCTGFWTGDVWRIIPCLKTFRPDLQIFTIPTKPSGLAVVTRLDSNSTVLSDHYQQIVEYYTNLNLPDTITERFRLLNVREAEWDAVRDRILKQNQGNAIITESH
jgi:tetratricopeptide (TPR) repeat protein